MESTQQPRNLIVTMVLCLGILIGWFWLQEKIWPRKQPQLPDDKGKVEARAWDKLSTGGKVNLLAATLIADSTPAAGLPEAWRLSADLERAEQLAPGFLPPPRSPWDELSTPRKEAVVHGTSGLPPAGLWPALIRLAAQHQILRREGLLRDTPELPDLTITLGDAKETIDALDKSGAERAEAKYFLHVELTSKGAGVQKVVLTQFQACDILGRPVQKRLELVQEDTFITSFLLHHFPRDPKDRKQLQKNAVAALAQKVWQVESKDESHVTFSTRVPDPDFQHIVIFKTFRLRERDYHIGLEVEFKDERDPRAKVDATPFRYQLAGAHGLPVEGVWYTATFRNAVIGMVDGNNNLYRTLFDAHRINAKKGSDTVPEGEVGGSNFLQYAGTAIQYFASMIVVDDDQPKPSEGGVSMKKILAWAKAYHQTSEARGILARVADDLLVLDDGVLPRSFVPLPRTRAERKVRSIKPGDPVVVSFYEHEGKNIAIGIRPGTQPQPVTDDFIVRVTSEAMELKPGDHVKHRFLLYHGPVKTALLGQFTGKKRVDAGLVERYTHTLHLRTLTDYKSEGVFGNVSQAIRFTDLLIACTKLMHWLLNWLHFFVPNYGLSIILLTVVVRGLMFPISRRQALISIKMQELAPEMKKIQEKHKNDARARTEATMELYRKHQVQPWGMCLPLLLQMPIFMGLYFALQESIHFRLASFLWIDNLAAPDMLLWWSERIPLISSPDNFLGGRSAGVFEVIGSFFYFGPYLNLLPFFAVTLMIMQQKLLTPPPTDEQQEMTQKMMKYMMIFVGLMFYKVAAGLCIYFTASSLWGLAERKLLPKKKAGKMAPGSAGGKGGGGGPGGGPGGKTAPLGPRGKPRPGSPKKENGALQKVKDWWAEVLKQARKK